MMATIPTLTTPTLTPTTLRNFESSVIGLDADDAAQLLNPSLHSHQGSFVPPLPTTTSSNTWGGGGLVTNDNDSFDESEPAAQTNKKPVIKKKRGGKRTTGGRKPKIDKNISPEEEERRRTRRERNKQAAARCRKRRVDHTNLLVEETTDLESTKRSIQDQITQLTTEKDELEFLLQAHRHCNKLKKKRPNTLPVRSQAQVAQQQVMGQGQAQTQTRGSVNSMELTTPSNGIISFDLDWSNLPVQGFTPAATPIITPGTLREVLSSLETPVKAERMEIL